MTFNDCVIECLQNKELIQQFDRLNGTKVMQAFHDNRAPIIKMIDAATGYDKVLNDDLRKDVMDFLWFCYGCVWMRLPENCRDLL